MPRTLLYLPNLTSIEMQEGNPWDWATAHPLPPEVCQNKKARDEWRQRSDINHCFYTGWVGRMARSRINENNPPRSASALVWDVDEVVPIAQMQAITGKLPPDRLPNYISHTLSDKFHLVYQLETPLEFVGARDAEAWAKEMLRILKLDLYFKSIDPKSHAPSQTFFNHCRWFQCSQKPLSATITAGAYQIAIARIQKEGRLTNERVTVSKERIAQELAQRYPGFSEWPGSFDVGAQGPTFWLEGSASDKSAIVHEEGLFSFSATASASGKQFYSWGDLLGRNFVEIVNLEREAAVDKIYYINKADRFLVPNPKVIWRYDNSDQIKGYLKELGFAAKKEKGEAMTEIEEVYARIRNTRCVKGIAPFLYNPDTIVDMHGSLYMNSSTVRVFKPAEEKVTWDDSRIKKFRQVATNVFRSRHNLHMFLSWMAAFYQSGYNLKPRPHPALLLCGPKSTGKSLLTTGFCSVLFGGHCEGAKFLAGDEAFGSEVLEAPLLTCDDQAMVTNRSARTKLIERSKGLTTNGFIKYHGKFQIPVMCQWNGAIAVTCNDDVSSLANIPDIYESAEDKWIVLHTGGDPLPHSQVEWLKFIHEEAPYIAAFLRDYKIPKEMTGFGRYAVKAYQDPDLMESARAQNSFVTQTEELLLEYTCATFAGNPKKQFMENTTHRWFEELSTFSPGLAREIKLNAFRVAMGIIASRSHPLVVKGRSSPITTWRVERNEERVSEYKEWSKTEERKEQNE